MPKDRCHAILSMDGRTPLTKLLRNPRALIKAFSRARKVRDCVSIGSKRVRRTRALSVIDAIGNKGNLAARRSAGYGGVAVRREKLGAFGKVLVKRCFCPRCPGRVNSLAL